MPGVSTAEINEMVHETLKKYGATPSFLGYRGFPAAACVSVNDEVIHGIPGRRRIRGGDIVKIDVGALIEGYHADTAGTFFAGAVSDDAKLIAEVTRQSFYAGLKKATTAHRLRDISGAIGDYAEQNGFSVVKAFTGHGIGAALHEDPDIPNYRAPSGLAGPFATHRLKPGMTLAIEPMVNAGTHAVRLMDDGWTVKTADGKLSAHYEHTVLITKGEPELLTL